MAVAYLEELLSNDEKLKNVKYVTSNFSFFDIYYISMVGTSKIDTVL